MNRLLIFLFISLIALGNSYGKTAGSMDNAEDFLVTFICENTPTPKVYVIYKSCDRDHSSGEISQILRCMVCSSQQLGYRNVYEGEVKESNGAFFLSFIFYQMSGEFGVVYDNVFYKIAAPGEDNFCDLPDNAEFDPSEKTVTYKNVMGEPRTIKLSEIPPENQVKLIPNWY